MPDPLSASPETPSNEIPLASLSVGRRAAIVQVNGPRVFRRRLLELGLTPGTDVTIVNIAPLGDPLELEVRHCHLSLRRSEAAAILVCPDAPARRALKVVP